MDLINDQFSNYEKQKNHLKKQTCRDDLAIRL